MKSIKLASFFLLVTAALPVAVGCSANASADEDIGTAESSLTRFDLVEPVAKRTPKTTLLTDSESTETTPSPTTPSPTTLQGTLNRIFVGRSQGGKGKIGYRWALNDGKQMKEVELSDAAIASVGGANRVWGKKVSLSGKLTVRDKILADIVGVLSTDFSGPPPVTPDPIVGTKKWLTVLCRFSELPNPDPHNLGYFQGLMGNAAPGVGDFWAKTSNGRLAIESTVLDWQDMPLPASFYKLGTPEENIFGLMGDCLGEAESQGVQYNEFDGLQIVFSHNLDSQLTGGPFELQLQGALKKYAVSVLSPVEIANQASVARGMGMGLNMTFSGSGPLHFDSPWDVMSQAYGTSNGISCRSLTSSFGCAAVLAAGEQTARSGWLDAANVASVAADSRAVINLDFVGQAPLAGHHGLIRLPIDSQHWYTIEAREQKAGTYDVGVPMTDIVIQSMDGSPLPDSPTEAQALEATTRLRPVASLNGATSYVNNDIRLKLDVTKQSWGYQVTVTRGPRLGVSYQREDVRITSSAGINCGQGNYACSITPSFGTTVTLTATPARNKRVSSWDGCSSSSGNTCIVTLDRSVTVHAHIVEDPPADDPDVCRCPPSMPAYKCQQICGGHF